MFFYRMCMKNAGNDTIFFIFRCFFSKMKCIVFSAQTVVTFLRFFQSGRDFFLVFKYVHMFSLKEIAKSFIFRTAARFFHTAAFFFNTNSIYFIFNSFDEKHFRFFLSDGEFYLFFRYVWFV